MIYASYLPEENLSQSQFNQLINDERVQLKYPHCFCFEKDKQALEKQYNISLFDGASSLQNLFASELSKGLRDFLEDLLDFDLMFEDDLILLSVDFNGDVDEYLLKARSIFLENVSYYLKNHDSCNNRAWNFLEWVSKNKM